MVSNKERTIYLHKFVLESAISKEGAHFSDIIQPCFRCLGKNLPHQTLCNRQNTSSFAENEVKEYLLKMN